MSRHPHLRPSLVALSLALVLQACTPLATLDTVVTRDRKVGAGQSIEVNIVRDGGAVDSEQEMELQVGDDLTTGPSSFAFVRFEGGTELVLLPSTDLVVGKGRIEVDGGALLGKVRGAFRVDTPHGWAEVVGTEVLVEIGGDSTVVTVLEGLVGVGWTGGPEQPVLVERGQRVVLTPGGDGAIEEVPLALLGHVASELNAVERTARGGRARLLVPQLIGIGRDEALELVGQLGLKPGEVDGRLTGESSVGAVVDQDPTPGSRLQAGKKVDLWFEAEPVEVPELVGAHRKRARALLEEAGLGIEEFKRATITGDVPENTVNQQNPVAGTVIRSGDPVKLRFEAASAIVPDLTGQTRAEAGLALTDLGLRVGTVTAELNEGLAIEGVQTQSPPAGERVPGDTAVALTLAMPAVMVPTVLGETMVEARAQLEAEELTVGRVVFKPTRAFDDASYVCAVNRQTPAAGELSAVGAAVDLRLVCQQAE